MVFNTVRAMSQQFASDFVKRQAINQDSDQNIGSATQNQDPVSASQLLSTLAPVALVALIWLIVFTIARPKFGWHYSPRASSRLLRSDEHSKPLSPGIFAWFKEFWAIPDSYVLQRSSLDAYFFLRFLKLSVVICLVGAAITWPILFPVNATGGGGQKQLDVLTFGNVASTWRYYAHVGCAYIFFGFILLMIYRETIYYINLRQAYLMNPAYARKLPSRTVLYTAVPDDFLDETRLREMLGPSVRRIWFPTNTKDLDDLVKDRSKAAMVLEGAETKLIRAANGARLKNKDHADPETGHENATADRWVSQKDRPTVKKPMLIGKKHDAIEWSRSEIERLSPEIKELQHLHREGGGKRVNAVFVEFESLSEAQAAFQSLTHHEILKMAPRFTGMHPAEVIWSNLRIKGWERFIRVTAVTSLVVATIIFWSFPVAVVGFISNIKEQIGPDGYLKWLNFLEKVPDKIFGVIQGLLPSVLLALLMSLLPPYLRFLAKVGGAPTTADVEHTLSNYYFGFQVVQVFLITTLSSAATAAVTQIISNPGSITNLLSEYLPKANNFYLSYIILQGLGVFAGTLAALSGLVITPLLAKFLGSTPRKLFLRWNSLKAMRYGAVFPIYTNLLVIAIAYSCIAPLVTGLSAIGLFFFYFAYRYNIIYVYTTGTDTKGLLFPRALQQLFVGLYIAEICIIGLIAASLGKGFAGAIGPLVLMIILLVITALFHVSLNASVSPLLKYLPKSLDAEERKAYQISKGEYNLNGVDSKDSATQNGDGAENVRKNTLLDAPKHPKPSVLQKFLKPHIYSDYATLRRLMPTEVDEDRELDPALHRDAYLAPSVWDEVPRLIVPRDPVGVSGTQVRDSGKIVPITDGGATLDEKNNMVLDDEYMADLYFKEKKQRMGYEI